MGLDAWEAYDRHLPVLCTLQRATNLGLQREDSWSLWGFNYANEYTRHGVRLPGAAYNNASTHAHVCLLWSWLSINDLQGYNFESLKPHFFSAAAPLSSARSSGVHIILLFFFNLHRNLLYNFCIVSTSICPSSRREHGIQAWPGCIYPEPQGQQSKPRLYMVQWAVSRTMNGCPEIGAGYPEFCLQGCRVG